LLSVWNFPSSLALHAFAFGGIGMVTLGMMARVSLGHTGRSVFDPPPVLLWVFLLLFVGGLFRVFPALLLQSYYSLWVTISMVLWMCSFTMFVVVYLPILLGPNADARPR